MLGDQIDTGTSTGNGELELPDNINPQIIQQFLTQLQSNPSAPMNTFGSLDGAPHTPFASGAPSFNPQTPSPYFPAGLAMNGLNGIGNRQQDFHRTGGGLSLFSGPATGTNSTPVQIVQSTSKRTRVDSGARGRFRSRQDSVMEEELQDLREAIEDLEDKFESKMKELAETVGKQAAEIQELRESGYAQMVEQPKESQRQTPGSRSV